MGSTTCTAFSGTHRIASGDVRAVAAAAKAELDRHPEAQILVFDDTTSQIVELDLRGTVDDVLARLELPPEPPAETRRPGRPKLGVVAREVTLLPRHWEWLASQPGGASVALRKLVDQARAAHQDRDRRRKAQDATYRFMTAMAGNEPGFEEALRALFAANRAAFTQLVAPWPAGIRDHVLQLASPALD